MLLLDGWENKTKNEKKNIAFMLHNTVRGTSIFVDSVTLGGDDHEDCETLYEKVRYEKLLKNICFILYILDFKSGCRYHRSI